MIARVFKLVKEIDTFREILLLGLTGATCLSLYLGYRVIQSDEIIDNFVANPTIIEYNHPCYLRFVRKDFYSVGIDFSVPKELQASVRRHSQAFVLDHKPDGEEFEQLCTALQVSILDQTIESWLLPIQKQPVSGS